jgi:uncharacterized RDD family membrane protein YckC
MDSNSTILDSDIVLSEFDPRLYMASAGQRFANYFLDLVFYYILIYLLSEVVSNVEVLGPIQIVFIPLHFLYFFVFEATLGKTPAKFITRTRVVNREGNLPATVSIAGRSISRFVPFDAFSFLGTFARGWHDRWSNTWVIDERKLSLMSASES